METAVQCLLTARSSSTSCSMRSSRLLAEVKGLSSNIEDPTEPRIYATKRVSGIVGMACPRGSWG